MARKRQIPRTVVSLGISLKSAFTNWNRRRCRLGLAALMLVWLTGFGTGTADQRTINIAVIGDSLVSGYGLAPGQSFPEQLQIALNAAGQPVVITNAGVSGDTSSGGLARLDWSVGEKIDAVIVELGANDALRGIGPKITKDNLRQIIVRLKARGIMVLLAGMRAPPNMGSNYVTEFEAIFPSLADKHEILLDPFFIEGVAARPHLNQDDGIHPNLAGVEIMVDRFMPFALRLIAKATDKEQ